MVVVAAVLVDRHGCGIIGAVETRDPSTPRLVAARWRHRAWRRRRRARRRSRVDSFASPRRAPRRARTATWRSTSRSAAATSKDLIIHLPPGLVGNPLATPHLQRGAAQRDSCPAGQRRGRHRATTSRSLGFLPQTAAWARSTTSCRAPASRRASGSSSTRRRPTRSSSSRRPPCGPSDFGLDTILTDLPQNATVGGHPDADHDHGRRPRPARARSAPRRRASSATRPPAGPTPSPST